MLYALLTSPMRATCPAYLLEFVHCSLICILLPCTVSVFCFRSGYCFLFCVAIQFNLHTPRLSVDPSLLQSPHFIDPEIPGFTWAFLVLYWGVYVRKGST
jgi:hypothetical protein